MYQQVLIFFLVSLCIIFTWQKASEVSQIKDRLKKFSLENENENEYDMNEMKMKMPYKAMETELIH